MASMRVVGWCSCHNKLLYVNGCQCREVVVTVGRTPIIEGVEEMGVPGIRVVCDGMVFGGEILFNGILNSQEKAPQETNA